MAIQSVNDASRVEWLVFAIFSLNVIDAVATIIWVSTGLAIEANPMMERLLNYHPLAFLVVKLTLVLLGSILLWRFRERVFAVVVLVSLFLVYYGLLLYHLSAGSLIFGDLYL